MEEVWVSIGVGLGEFGSVSGIRGLGITLVVVGLRTVVF